MQTTFLTGIIIALLLLFPKDKKDTGINLTGTTDLLQHHLDTSKWYLKRIRQDTGMAEVNSKKAFIRFNESKGSAGGNGSCNSFGSTMTVNAEAIRFTDIFSTKMYCDDVQAIENNFLRQLQKVTRYEVKSKTLLLFDVNDVVLELEK